MINIPIAVLALMSAVGLGMDIAKHKERREGYYNAWSTLIAQIIVWSLLIWGLNWK